MQWETKKFVWLLYCNGLELNPYISKVCLYWPFVFIYFEMAPFVLIVQAELFGHFLLHSYFDIGLFNLSVLMGRGSMRINTRVKEMISVPFSWECLAWTIHFKPFSWLCPFQTEGLFSCISAPTKWSTERKPCHKTWDFNFKIRFWLSPYCFLREMEGWVHKAGVGRSFEILPLELQILVWHSNIKLELLFRERLLPVFILFSLTKSWRITNQHGMHLILMINR